MENLRISATRANEIQTQLHFFKSNPIGEENYQQLYFFKSIYSLSYDEICYVNEFLDLGLGGRAFDKGENKYGYQGKYSEEDDETGWNEFDLRMYNPQTGVWSGVDPMDEFASPYIGMGANPVNLTDPSGGGVEELFSTIIRKRGGGGSRGINLLKNGFLGSAVSSLLSVIQNQGDPIGNWYRLDDGKNLRYVFLRTGQKTSFDGKVKAEGGQIIPFFGYLSCKN